MAVNFTIKDFEVTSVLNGTIALTLANPEVARELSDKDFSGNKVTITNPKKKSRNANSYLWELCTAIADKMSKSKEERWFKEDVYREAIAAAGVWEDVAIKGLTSDKLKEFERRFCEGHVGQFVQELQSTREWTYIRCYYGSSSYTQQELSRVIDYVVRKALDEGVDPDTPQERERLLSLWKG